MGKVICLIKHHASKAHGEVNVILHGFLTCSLQGLGATVFRPHLWRHFFLRLLTFNLPCTAMESLGIWDLIHCREILLPFLCNFSYFLFRAKFPILAPHLHFVQPNSAPATCTASFQDSPSRNDIGTTTARGRLHTPAVLPPVTLDMRLYWGAPRNSQSS